MDTLRADAIKALGEVLRDTGAKPADRLRAAEAIMRAENLAPAADSDLAELSDEALLLIAKGGTPPEMGPAGTSAETVPSHAVQPATGPGASPGAGPDGPGASPGAGPDVSGPGASPGASVGTLAERISDHVGPPSANPLMRKGPKEDPVQQAPRGVPSAMGPKEDPSEEGTPEPWM
jgi:hypothetical protein